MDLDFEEKYNLIDDQPTVSVLKNPWNVESVSFFSFFCCPECAYRSQTETDFKQHAVKSHPQVCEIRQQLKKFPTLAGSKCHFFGSVNIPKRLVCLFVCLFVCLWDMASPASPNVEHLTFKLLKQLICSSSWCLYRERWRISNILLCTAAS
jgi:hypothetical protein